MMEDEVVTRRRWLTHDEFVDLLGATNLIPGPNSTELAIHIGHRRAGLAGLIVAGACFILPAALLVGGVAWAYTQYGTLPQVEGALYGIKPVVIAIIAQALWRLGPSVLKGKLLIGLTVMAVALGLVGVHELVILFGVGLCAVVLRGVTRRRHLGKSSVHLLGVIAATPASYAGGAAVTLEFSNGSLFLFFLIVGSVLFGSGYVLLAFLRADLVERWQWLTETQLLDAVAVGQVTPGPVFTTATFIGYLLDGPRGALVATVGIFLPAFFFVAISSPWIPRLRQSKVLGDLLDGINAGSLALMAVVTLQLGLNAVTDVVTVALVLVSLVLLLRYRWHSTCSILGGATAGLISRALPW